MWNKWGRMKFPEWYTLFAQTYSINTGLYREHRTKYKFENKFHGKIYTISEFSSNFNVFSFACGQFWDLAFHRVLIQTSEKETTKIHLFSVSFIFVLFPSLNVILSMFSIFSNTKLYRFISIYLLYILKVCTEKFFLYI